MAFSLVGHVKAQSTNTTGVTTGTLDTTGADLLVLVLSDFAGGARGTISDSKGNSWTPLTSRTSVGNRRVTIFYSLPTTVGSGHTFTSTGGAGADFPAIAITAWSGRVGGVFDVENGAIDDSGSTLATGSVTPAFDNALIISGWSGDGTTGSLAIDSGMTLVDSFTAPGEEGLGHAYKVQTTKAAINPTWTPWGGNTSEAVAIAVFNQGLHASPGVGSIVTAGKALGTILGVGIAAGSLILTGLAPTALFRTLLPVPVGSIVITGLAPGLQQALPMPLGAITIAGLAPSYQVSRVITVGLGAVTMTGLTPALLWQVPVPAGAAALTGLTPAAQWSLPIGSAALVFTGLAPARQISIQFFLPSGALALTGLAPALRWQVPIPKGAITISGTTVFVAGVFLCVINNQPVVIQPDWTIDATANGRDVATLRIKSADGSYRPTLDQDVLLLERGTAIFGGQITRPTEAGWGGLGVAPIYTTVTAMDYNALADRRYFSGTIPAGTLKAALLAVIGYLPGASLDPTQVDGPTLPDLVYADVKMVDILNDFTTQSGGYLWHVDYTKLLSMFTPGSKSAPFNITAGPPSLAVGDVTVEPTRQGYANRIIVRTSTLRSQADNAGEQVTHGVWEALYNAPDTMTQADCDALASQILARSIVVLKQVVYHAERSGLACGQTQTINLPFRNVNNTFLIAGIRTRQLGPLMLDHEVTAIEGLTYQAGWKETWRNMAAGGGLSTGGAGGSGGGVSLTRYAYFLASGVDAVQSPTPTWLPATGGDTTLGKGSIQAQISTIPRGTTAAVVTARLRALAAGISVQARLYDVSAGAPCPGTSAVVTSTDWTTVTFAVTLTAGSHLYELQLLPGTANADVAASGYIE